MKLNYNTRRVSKLHDTTGGINATTITSDTGAELEVQFTGFDYPGAVMAYGYNYTQTNTV